MVEIAIHFHSQICRALRKEDFSDIVEKYSKIPFTATVHFNGLSFMLVPIIILKVTVGKTHPCWKRQRRSYFSVFMSSNLFLQKLLFP